MIDCHTSDADAVAGFWAKALGRPVDDSRSLAHYRMLETPSDPRVVEIQRAEHESRIDLDIETSDDTAAEVGRLEKLGAGAVDRPARWVVMPAPTGQRFCVDHPQRSEVPKNANRRV